MAVPPEPSVEVPAMDGPRCRRARAIVNPWAGRFTRIQPNLRRDATPYGTPASQSEASIELVCQPMEQRLHRAGIFTVAQLWRSFSPASSALSDDPDHGGCRKGTRPASYRRLRCN